MTEEERKAYIQQWCQMDTPEFDIGDEVIYDQDGYSYYTEIRGKVGIIKKQIPVYVDEREDAFWHWDYDVEIEGKIINGIACYRLNPTRKTKIKKLLNGI